MDETQKASLAELNQLLTPDAARAAILKLQNDGADMPVECRRRLIELFERRANGGELTAKDADFYEKYQAAKDSKTAAALCAETSPNTVGGWLFASVVLGSVVAVIIVSNVKKNVE